jgi:DDE superfamily endonuclease
VRTVERTRRLLVTEGFEAVLRRKPSPDRRYRKLDGGAGRRVGDVGLLEAPGRAGVADVADVGRPAGGAEGGGLDRPGGGADDASKNDLQPWLREQWILSPPADAEFVCATEDVLDVSQRPYDPKRPVVCLDEPSEQLIRGTRTPIPAKPGRPERVDDEYERNGTANLFMVFEPLAGRRRVEVTDRRTKIDFAHGIRELVDEPCGFPEGR